MNTSKFFDSIDYAALQTQKLYLLNLTDNGQDKPEMWAIIHLIDALQDAAVADGVVSEQEAFPV